MGENLPLVIHQAAGREGWSLPVGAVRADSPLVYLIGVKPDPQELQPVIDLLPAGGVVLAGYDCPDWNRELSPWPAEPVSSNSEAFAGAAPRLLSWLYGSLEPQVCARYDLKGSVSQRCIAGYSLAGLFALWAAHTSKAFAGAASCSGSLWYPGWLDFAALHKPAHGMIVYLSLGDKEDKSGPALMRTVAVATRKAYERYQDDLGIAKAVFVQEKGNHFKQPEARLARGVAWLCSSLGEGKI